jgi:arginine repressor
VSHDEKPDEEHAEKLLGLSVCVETMEDGEKLVGIIVHTKDVENVFMIRLPPAQARALASNIDLAADSAALDLDAGSGYQ